MADIPPWHPPTRLRLFLVFWRLAWFLLMPGMLFYLWYRGRRDALYRQRIGQRFGFHTRREEPHIWVHAVSIGELRSAVPLIHAFLDRGERVVTTHFTPAGLREAENVFADEIASGMLSAGFVPFDYGLAFRRFFRAFRPKFGLVMEVEFWPGMITAARRSGMPLFLCNGQYPVKSFERDREKALSPALLVPGFAGVMVKSELQEGRFRELGQVRVAVTGEMRFEQPVPAVHLEAASETRSALFNQRRVITLASVVEPEEDQFIDAVTAVQKAAPEAPRFVFVPRAPERFGPVAEKLKGAGIRFARRSEVLDAKLAGVADVETDVLLGDSLGEMYFYLAMCDVAVVGGGFNPNGSHNIIEPLALGKPVLVGPEIWTIEYPAVEAIAAGVARQIAPGELNRAMLEPVSTRKEDIRAFLDAHAGSVEKTLRTLDEWL